MKNEYKDAFIFFGFTLLIALSIYVENSSIIYGNSIPKYYLIITGSILLALISLLLNFRKYYNSDTVKIDIIEILIILFYIWNILSINTLTNTTGTKILFNLSLIIILLLARRLIHSDRYKYTQILLGFFCIIAFLGALQAIYGIGQFAIYNLFNMFESGLGKSADLISGSSGAQNGYGNFIALSLVAILYIISKNRDMVKKPILELSSIAILIAFIVCQSRGAWLSFILSTVILLFLRYYDRILDNKLVKKLKTKLTKKSAIVIGASIILPIVLLIFYLVIFKMDIESTWGRIYIWRISFNVFKDNLLTGVGFCNFGNEFLKYQTEFLSKPGNSHFIQKATTIGSAHNQFLYHFCETGVIGGMLYISIWFVILRNLYNKIKEEVSNDVSYVYLLSFILILFFHSMVDTILLVIPLQLIFFIAISFVPSKSYHLKLSDISSKIVKTLILLSIILAIIFTSKKFITEYSGYEYWGKGMISLRKANYQKAINNFNKAVNYLPNENSLKSKLGRALIGAGKNKDGVKELKNILNKFRYRDPYLALSLGEMKLDNINQSEQYAKKAHSMFPDQLRPIMLLSEIYYIKGDISKSRKYLNICVKESTHVKSKLTENLSKSCKDIYSKWFDDDKKTLKDSIKIDKATQNYIDSVMIAH